MNRRSFGLGAGSLCVPFVLKASTKVEVELCLLLDCSSSMFEKFTNHFLVQLRGHTEALAMPVIQESWLPYRPLVSLFVWADNVLPLFSMQMMNVDDFTSLGKELIASAPTETFGGGRTFHKEALRYFSKKEKTTLRRVLDISTDEGPIAGDQSRCRELRDTLYATGTQVNVLSIDDDGASTKALEDCLVTPNGFVHKIGGFRDYKKGIAKKMALDLMM